MVRSVCPVEQINLFNSDFFLLMTSTEKSIGVNNSSYCETIELLQDYKHGARESWRPMGIDGGKKLFVSVWEKQRQMWSFHKPLNRLMSLKLCITTS